MGLKKKKVNKLFKSKEFFTHKKEHKLMMEKMSF